jgi:hypothetical protein
MVKLLIGLLTLLAVWYAVGVWRKPRHAPTASDRLNGATGQRYLRILHRS